MTTHIESTAQWRQVVSGHTIVVTDFYADWCGPCKMIAPTFESLATKHAKPKRIAFAKVDVDRQRDVAQQYGVRAMPTFIILKNGSVIDTIQGANPQALTAAVDKAVKLAGAAASGALFSSPGHTLGGRSGAGSSARGPGPRTLGRPPAWDINNLINRLITFFGLYFTTLFSLDAYMAAQKSQFNVHNTTPKANTGSVPINAGRSAGGSSAGGSKGSGAGSGQNRGQPKSSFRTLADLE